jgi:TonB-dependent receptor
MTVARMLARSLGASAIVALAVGLLVADVHAQSAATGVIDGRVLNASNGKYLGSAVISVEGSNLEAVSDDYGYFEIRNVPAGKTTLKATYSGQAPQTISVDVTAGKTTTKEVQFGSAAGKQADGSIILDTFQVAADRFKNAREIAINEERQSVNIKNVVSADQFGDIPGGNVGEFVKFLPGVQISYGGPGTGVNQGYSESDASGISIRGFGPEDTAVLIDGMPVSNSSPGSLTRQVGLDMLSINNASRVELIKVATPDMPANSVGGQVNLITKSAFEYAKPSISTRIFVNVNSLNTKLGKTPGPVNKKTYKTTPGGEFSVSYPLTSKLGFTLTGFASNDFNQSYRAQPTLTTAGTFTNAAGATATYSNPAISRYQITDTSSLVEKRSGNIKLDWKPTTAQLLTANFQLSTYDSVEGQRRLDARPTVAAGADWGSTFTTGTTANSTLDQTVTTRDRVGDTKSGQLQYKYQLGGWNISAGGSLSVSTGDYKDRENGHFSEIGLKLNPGQVNFSNISESRPGTITTYRRVANGGAQTDYTKLSNWGFDQTIAKSGEAKSKSTVGLYKIDVERDLDFIPWLGSNSLSIKIGARRDQEKLEKSGVGTGYQEILDTGKSYLISDIFDDSYVGRSPGFDAPAQEWGSTYKLFALNQANKLFIAPADGANAITNYNSYANQQKSLTETTDAGYAMLSGRFFKNRLKMVGGLRQEEKTREGRGPFTDSKWNYAKKSNGTLYIDNFYTTGVKLDGSAMTRVNADGTTTNVTSFLTDSALLARMTAAGVKYPDHLYGLPATSLESRMLQLVANRRISQKVKGDPSASLSAAFDLTKKIAVKAAWSRSFKLPNLESGTSGLLSGNGAYTINENVPVAADGTKGTIAVANPGLLPETATNWDYEVSYFTDSGGKFSVSYYTKSVTNQSVNFSSFSGSPVFEAVLPALGLNPSEYQDWRLTTSSNSTSKQSTHGYEFQVVQDFAFLGKWGRHFSGFASYSMKSLGAAPVVAPYSITSPSGAQIVVTPTVNAITLTANRFAGAGLQFATNRLSLQVRGTYRNDNEQGANRVTLPNGNFLRRFEPAETRIDVNATFQLTKRYSLFVSGRDVMNGTRETILRDDLNLLPRYAQIFDKKEFGHAWTFGVNGKF